MVVVLEEPRHFHVALKLDTVSRFLPFKDSCMRSFAQVGWAQPLRVKQLACGAHGSGVSASKGWSGLPLEHHSHSMVVGTEVTRQPNAI